MGVWRLVRDSRLEMLVTAPGKFNRLAIWVQHLHGTGRPGAHFADAPQRQLQFGGNLGNAVVLPASSGK